MIFVRKVSSRILCLSHVFQRFPGSEIRVYFLGFFKFGKYNMAIGEASVKSSRLATVPALVDARIAVASLSRQRIYTCAGLLLLKLCVQFARNRSLC